MLVHTRVYTHVCTHTHTVSIPGPFLFCSQGFYSSASIKLLWVSSGIKAPHFSYITLAYALPHKSYPTHQGGLKNINEATCPEDEAGGFGNSRLICPSSVF